MEYTTFTTLPLDIPMEGIISLSNSFAPINLLPAELLIEIFGHLRRAAGFNGDLVAATHVCRHWREVAIRAPELWTAVKLDNVPAAMAFLVRSQSLPISVFVGEPPQDILPDVAHALEPHLHRVQAFDGEFQELPDLIAFPGIFLRPAAVRRLSLYLEDEASQEFFRTHDAQDILPIWRHLYFPDVQELITTSLPGLTLDGFTKLTSLHLDGLLPTVETMLPALATCAPSLRRLNISGWWLGALPTQGLVTADLSNLETLTLNIRYDRDAFKLLKQLVVPETCSITIDVDVEDSNPFHQLPQADVCFRGLRQLAVAWGGARGTELRVCGWKNPNAVMPTFTLRIAYGQKFDNPLLPAWPVDVSEVRRLDLDMGGYMPETEFDAGLGCFPKLETMRVTRLEDFGLFLLCHALEKVVTVAVQAADPTGPQGAAVMRDVLTHCPRLSHIELGMFDWYAQVKLHVAPVARRRREAFAPNFAFKLFDMLVQEEGKPAYMWNIEFDGQGGCMEYPGEV
ncbi:hypothetical protein FKP32DRAFT_1417877 [Trametes sanguinea]|nr:hypothetical protein FKP32DRAFT_1417877 [Trametes sanguinea]